MFTTIAGLLHILFFLTPTSFCCLRLLLLVCLCSLLHPTSTAVCAFNRWYIPDFVCHFRCCRFVERWSIIMLLIYLDFKCTFAFIPSGTDSSNRCWWDMTLSDLVVTGFACVVGQLFLQSDLLVDSVSDTCHWDFCLDWGGLAPQSHDHTSENELDSDPLNFWILTPPKHWEVFPVIFFLKSKCGKVSCCQVLQFHSGGVLCNWYVWFHYLLRRKFFVKFLRLM